MSAVTWEEVVQLQQDVRLIQMAVEALQKRVNEMAARFQKQAEAQQSTATTDHPKRLTDLKGIWKGAGFSYEEIKAVKYREPDDWWL